MKQFSGNDLREIRKKHRLKRSEMAQYLGVSPVTIEKWEQHGEEKIRPKYLEKISSLAGVGAVGVGVGMFAAPALIPFAAILGGGAMIGGLLNDNELAKASDLVVGLKKLSPSERKKLFAMIKKMGIQKYPPV